MLFRSRKPEMRSTAEPARPPRQGRESKPPSAGVVVKRDCLRCRHAFCSSHVGNRLCQPCSGSIAGMYDFGGRL